MSTGLAVSIAAWVAFEAAMQLRQRRLAVGPRRFDPSAIALVACVGLGVGAAVRLGRNGPLDWPGGRVWPVVVGIALIVAGAGLRVWSIATLGRFFQYHVQVQSGHEVVTGGPYRYVRHPSYSGLLVAVLGIAVATRDVLSPVATVALTAVGLAIRIRIEERQLSEALGDAYERFKATRKRVVPGVW